MTEDFSKIIVAQIDRLLEQQVTRDILTAADRGDWPTALWDTMNEAGLPHAMMTDAAGGLGLAAADAMGLMRRMGYHALPLPLAETMVANYLFVEANGAPLDGPVSFAPVRADDAIAIAFSRDGAVLSGVARHVPWGSVVHRLVVFARDDSGKGYLARVARDMMSLDRRRRNVAYELRDDLRLDGIRLPLDAVVEAPVFLQADGLLPYVAAIRAQQMVGGMERALDHALTYANERVQFGRPIAKFQAIQHMLAIAAGHFAAASAAADAMAEASRFADDLFTVAVAKSRCGEAAGRVAAACHQVHGAMGFTHEHALHFTTRRLWSWRDEGGAESYWQEWIGRKVCALGGDTLWPAITGR
ncbi:MAG: acyl-CoA dehydrogenase family protein [Xanthobacteraceae bacterium]